jgi:hypothetical protein
MMGNLISIATDKGDLEAIRLKTLGKCKDFTLGFCMNT